MSTKFEDFKVSVAVLRGVKSPYDDATYSSMVEAVAGQDHSSIEVLAVDGSGSKPPTVKGDFKHLRACFFNRPFFISRYW